MKVDQKELNAADTTFDNTRRDVIKRGFNLAIMSFPVLIALNSRKVLADEEGDETKIKFHYQDHPNRGMKCAQCVYYVPPAPNGLTGVCRIIDGDVTANSWCTAFRTA